MAMKQNQTLNKTISTLAFFFIQNKRHPQNAQELQ